MYIRTINEKMPARGKQGKKIMKKYYKKNTFPVIHLLVFFYFHFRHYSWNAFIHVRALILTYIHCDNQTKKNTRTKA